MATTGAERDSDRPPRNRMNAGPDTPKYFPSGVPKRYPRDFTVSRRRGVMVPECWECGGPIIAENRGGPVITHTKVCSLPPRRFRRVAC
jgi:hypothetical protein